MEPAVNVALMLDRTSTLFFRVVVPRRAMSRCNDSHDDSTAQPRPL
jgi:hypothetical protein